MTAWAQDELQKIAEADDLHIAPFRANGTTYGTPTWIWSVAVDGDLYVRAYNGQSSRWHQAAMRQKEGRILAGGLTKRSRSSPSAQISTIASMRPTAPSTAAVPTSTP